MTMNTRQKKLKKKRRSRNGFLELLNALLTMVVLGVLVAGGIFFVATQRYYAKGPMSENRVFLVEQGLGLAAVANRLETANLIANRWIFQFGAMLQRKQSSIRAGEYQIAANASMAEIILEITEGRAITYSVTIPEGLTSWEAVQRINAAPNLTGEITVIPAEGSLLPNTYSFERGSDRQLVIDRMGEAFQVEVAQIWETRSPDLPLNSIEEMVILASIVEKETGIGAERAGVAGVFINRINIGMRLQSDPTIIYGITNGQGSLGRGLRRSEIDEKTPYNTYQIDGLPPTPIANPGVAAMRAVVNPDDTEALFFVADGTGGHVFANTYAEHQVNVARWRVIEREMAAEAAKAAELAQEEAEAEATRDALQQEQAPSVDSNG
ncbi:MAG: endolytic transglycosylase MltG [Devosiaceae bacterium]|nr:endolytic transglycosylase MltG [Devosiaceae bacterium]